MNPARKEPNRSRKLYKPLLVNDARVSGSITLGDSRLPIWAIPHHFDIQTHQGTETYTDAYDQEISDADLGNFLDDLLNCRKSQARLLLALANNSRLESKRSQLWLIEALTECLQVERTEHMGRP